MIRFLFHLVLMLHLVSCSPNTNKSSIRQGDILFQEGHCGDFCQAIKDVTVGYQGKMFTHNGLVVQEEDSLFVVEAVFAGVVKTPLKDFLNRHVDEAGKPRAMIGRLKPEFQYCIPRAVSFVNSRLGKTYDKAFDFNNDAYYCSELLYFAFVDSIGNPLFTPEPMTFKSPKSDSISALWKNYFKELDLAIPEGELGINPGLMSRSKIVEMKTL